MQLETGGGCVHCSLCDSVNIDQLGSGCEEQKVWCVFLKTKGNKKCKAGDVLRISGISSGKKILKR